MRSSDVSLLVLRIWLSLSLFIKHGIVMDTDLLRTIFNSSAYKAGAVYIIYLLVAAIADSVCTVFILLGVFTRTASLIIAAYLLFVFVFLNRFSFVDNYGEL